MNSNTNSVFVKSLRKGSGTGGNPTPYAREKSPGRGRKEKQQSPPPVPDEPEEPAGQSYTNPLATLRNPADDMEYTYPGRTHPGVYNPHTKEFDGGYANYYESPNYLYDRGITFQDLPNRMPSARDLQNMRRGPDGLPLLSKTRRAQTATDHREAMQLVLSPRDREQPRITPDQSTGRAMGSDVRVRDLSGAQTERGYTTHRQPWHGYYDDDSHYWKGAVPGRDHYRPHAEPPHAAADNRHTATSIQGSLHRDYHGGAPRSMFAQR